MLFNLSPHILKSLFFFFLISGVEANLSVVFVQDETVCVSPWGEDGCGVWETLDQSVL